MKTFNRFFLSLVGGLTIAAIFLTSCNKRLQENNVEVQENPIPETIDKSSSIGEVHNYLLAKAFERFYPSTRSDSEQPINAHEVIDYWLSLEYFNGVSKEERYSIQEAIEKVLLEIEKNNLTTTDAVAELFEKKAFDEIGDIDPTTEGNLRSAIDHTDNASLKAIYNDVYRHSMNFWSSRSPLLRASGDAAIAADAAGAAWGAFFGSVGAAIAGPIASFIANDPERVKNCADNYDWRCNPKYI